MNKRKKNNIQNAAKKEIENIQEEQQIAHRLTYLNKKYNEGLPYAYFSDYFDFDEELSRESKILLKIRSKYYEFITEIHKQYRQLGYDCYCDTCNAERIVDPKKSQPYIVYPNMINQRLFCLNHCEVLVELNPQHKLCCTCNKKMK